MVRLLSDTETTRAILDTLTTCCLQLCEFIERRKQENPGVVDADFEDDDDDDKQVRVVGAERTLHLHAFLCCVYVYPLRSIKCLCT